MHPGSSPERVVLIHKLVERVCERARLAALLEKWSCLMIWDTWIKVDGTWDGIFRPFFALRLWRLFVEPDRIYIRVFVVVWKRYVTLLINSIFVAFVIWRLINSFRESTLSEAIYGVPLVAGSESIRIGLIFKMTFQKTLHLWRKLQLIGPCWNLQRVSHIDSSIFIFIFILLLFIFLLLMSSNCIIILMVT